MCVLHTQIHRIIRTPHHPRSDEDSFADHGKLEGLFLGDTARRDLRWTFVQPLTESTSWSQHKQPRKEYVWQAPLWVVYHASGRQLLRWTSLCLTFRLSNIFDLFSLSPPPRFTRSLDSMLPSRRKVRFWVNAVEPLSPSRVSLLEVWTSDQAQNLWRCGLRGLPVLRCTSTLYPCHIHIHILQMGRSQNPGALVAIPTQRQMSVKTYNHPENDRTVKVKSY
jgi:hypothetical protein